MCSKHILLVGLITLAYVQLCLAQQDSRIVGGTETTISLFPYLMQVYSGSAFICGGTLVRVKAVVTAAHCADGSAATQLSVRGGANVMFGSGVTRRVKRIVKPSAYNSNTLHFDVAIFELMSPMTGTNIAVIPLCTAAVPNGAAVKLAGWGDLSESGVSATRLRTTEVNIVDFATCKSRYGSELTNAMICAARSGRDTCSGDSGGPLVYRNQLCGVVSWGRGCARPKYPGVYTDLMKVMSFINTSLKQIT